MKNRDSRVSSTCSLAKGNVSAIAPVSHFCEVNCTGGNRLCIQLPYLKSRSHSKRLCCYVNLPVKLATLTTSSFGSIGLGMWS